MGEDLGLDGAGQVVGVGAVHRSQAPGDVFESAQVLASIVLGLGHTIGKEHQGIAGSQLQLVLTEVGTCDDAEHEVGLAELFDPVSADPERRRVSGVGVLDHAGGQIETAEKKSHELRLRQGVLQRVIELRDENGRRRIVPAEDAE